MGNEKAHKERSSMFTNVTIEWSDSRIKSTELPKGWYDFFIDNGVISVLCYEAEGSKKIVAANIYNPTKIKQIYVRS